MSSTMEDTGLGHFISSLTNKQKQALIDSIQSQLGVKSFNFKEELQNEPVKKKRGRPPKKIVEREIVLVKKSRGRPKKVGQEIIKRVSGRKTNAVVIDEDISPEEEQKIREASKILTETRIPIKSETRKPNPLIKAKCKNCGREIRVASNFPNIKNFVCCIK